MAETVEVKPEPGGMIRFTRKESLLSRGAFYLVLMVLVVGGYALLISGLGLIFSATLGASHPLVIGLAIFLLSITILPFQHQLRVAVDNLFLKGERVFQERSRRFADEVNKLSDPAAILRFLRQTIESQYTPFEIHIFILDVMNDRYRTTEDESQGPTSDIHFPASSQFVQLLQDQKHSSRSSTLEMSKSFSSGEKSRLILLGSEVFIPMPGRRQLTGWVALGPRRGGLVYSDQDLILLESVCGQAALAMERAEVLSNMDNRVREMNVLARIAQGVNITLSQDDMLELVYAQATQIIQAEDFHVFLMEPGKEGLVVVFNVEKGERLHDLEKQAVTGGQPLEMEVQQQRKPLLTADYSHECQSRGILANQDVSAWVGVPLNAGADTIGVLSLGKREAGATFSQEQLNLLQAIADQVAGAIVKLRLLQETERRARQLSTLNEMSRQLTSTLEQEPLLQNILQSATDILNCEAGSLLLVDEQSGDLVFRVTVGPVASSLLNQRMSTGSGLVGKAVKTRQSLIVNNVQQSPDWFSKTDQSTGYFTRSILVVPLQVKEKVTGVIEVLNKKDGSPFGNDDESLLSAFAAQAAVAVENARLFTMTDQALAEKVEELSVMQRIDRELNTSLDMNKAMQISLEWAMRQSTAMAGLVGVAQGNRLKVIAYQGYGDELSGMDDGMAPIKLDQYQRAISEGLPARIAVDGEATKGILAGTKSQVALPIRREGVVIGLVILEGLKVDPPTEDTMAFLQRLADHASIAISNAQLYATVQMANVAKSEFVSFVSHELKNPMTSIKGYTELLAAKAVGPVNDAQANFLATIRSNIERMNILISDLNDVSKIEAGRLRLDFKSFAMAEVVEEVVRSTRRQIEDKGQKLTQAVPADLPLVWADRTRVVQVVVNLVSNANKYTPQNGEVLVGAEACENSWDPGGAPRVVHIWVKDNGIGISDEDQKKIFQKFFRSEDPKTREAPGTGLGLNITRSLVEMQAGKIWFESEFRKGTTFHFTIPVAG